MNVGLLRPANAEGTMQSSTLDEPIRDTIVSVHM